MMKNTFFALISRIFHSAAAPRCGGNSRFCGNGAVFILAAVFLFSAAATADNHFCENPESWACANSLHLAAEQGVAESQFKLGAKYYNGEGVDKNLQDAAKWYRRAAEQGYAEAQNNLGFMYANGEGVNKNFREAEKWYRRAAEQGYAAAQFNLGFMYYNGEGVDKNLREAEKWFRRAAEQGLAEAQNNLGAMYWNGQGVIEDEREAYIWYSIAKANGNKYAADNLQKIPWHQYLTVAEIKSAKAEAARRLEEIENRAANIESEPASVGETPATPPPQTAGIAEKVFENAWRSIVVVKSGGKQGSGVIILPNFAIGRQGLFADIVATNCHVLDGNKITVYKHDNRRASTDTVFAAHVYKRDDKNDFCLLDVPGLSGVPPSIRKYDTLKIGETVYALGSPKGLDLSLSSGLISQLRQGGGERVIQTDAAISPGSSGGGLFDSEGNLIGITTAIHKDVDAENIGYAIPADLALNL